MKTTMNFQIPVILSFLILFPVMTQAQTDKKAADLKKLEIAIVAARTKIALNERQLDVSDSLQDVGTQMLIDAKTETKAIGEERKKLDKDFSSQQKAMVKLTESKDKEEALKAKADLKALGIQYKADTKVLDNRLKLATKKTTTGKANLSKGKTSGKTASDALKISQDALETAQEKYDIISAAGETDPGKGEKKK